jgi:hypothetical protein
MILAFMVLQFRDMYAGMKLYEMQCLLSLACAYPIAIA